MKERIAIDITFGVSNNIGFRYRVYRQKVARSCVVQQDASGFLLTKVATTFLCPQSKSTTGFARTMSIYETSYTFKAPIGKMEWESDIHFHAFLKSIIMGRL